MSNSPRLGTHSRTRPKPFSVSSFVSTSHHHNFTFFLSFTTTHDFTLTGFHRRSLPLHRLPASSSASVTLHSFSVSVASPSFELLLPVYASRNDPPFTCTGKTRVQTSINTYSYLFPYPLTPATLSYLLIQESSSHLTLSASYHALLCSQVWLVADLCSSLAFSSDVPVEVGFIRPGQTLSFLVKT